MNRALGPAIARSSMLSADVVRGAAYRAMLLAIVLGPSSLSFTIAGRGSDWTRDPVVRLVDAPLLVIAFLLLRAVVMRSVGVVRVVVVDRRAAAPDLAVLSLTLLVAWVGVAWSMHPRAIGGLMVLRLVGLLGVVELLRTCSVGQRRMVLKTMIGLVASEAALCVAQLIVNGPIGFAFLGELADPFNRTGPWRAPTGTSYYPYPLSAVALLTLGVVLWAVDRRLLGRGWACTGAVAAGVVVGTGYSVIGAVIAVTLVVAFALRSPPLDSHRFLGVGGLALALFVGSLAVTGTALSEGWRWKGERSASTQTALASSGRTDQLEIGVAMSKRWPVFGIGAGNFAVVREAHHEFDAVSPDAQITHSMPVLVAVEAGFPALGLFFVSLGLLAWRRVRAVVVIGVSLSGYLLGDLMLWYSGFGVFFLAIWLGFLVVADNPVKGATEIKLPVRPADT